MTSYQQSRSPLERLRRHKDKKGRPLINASQLEAGEKIFYDFTLSSLTQDITMHWSEDKKNGVPSARKSSATQHIDHLHKVMTAKKRFSQAMKALGPELSAVIMDVCCHMKGLEETERVQGWPQRSGKIVLQIALSVLARHYGFATHQTIPFKSCGEILSWRSSDFRPA